jgi:integrase
VRYCHTIFKAALREAVSLIATNPADRAKPQAAREAKAPEIHPWTAAQLSSFLAWASDQNCADVVAYRVLAYTGMRRGELLALRWRDLDLDAGRVSVRRSVGVVKTKGRVSGSSWARRRAAGSELSISTQEPSRRCVVTGWPAPVCCSS